MELIEWNESFSVGDVLMDTHHRVFFEMVKEFSELQDKTGFDAIKKRIDFLVDYTIMHLRAEEKLMEQANYPEIERHKAIHEAFALRVLSIRDSYAEAPGSIPADVILRLMQDWFVNHIMETDKLYTPYIQKLQG